mgnify:CR=1 FL=1
MAQIRAEPNVASSSGPSSAHPLSLRSCHRAPLGVAWRPPEAPGVPQPCARLSRLSFSSSLARAGAFQTGSWALARGRFLSGWVVSSIADAAQRPQAGLTALGAYEHPRVKASRRCPRSARAQGQPPPWAAAWGARRFQFNSCSRLLGKCWRPKNSQTNDQVVVRGST